MDDRYGTGARRQVRNSMAAALDSLTEVTRTLDQLEADSSLIMTREEESQFDAKVADLRAFCLRVVARF